MSTSKPSQRNSQGRSSFSDLTRRQRYVTILMLVALPFAVLLVLEAGLRVAGYGDAHPLFVAFEPAPEYLLPNPEVGQRYFRHDIGVPAPLHDLFRAEKAPSAYRIFVQGGSTAAGFPYSHGGAFSRMLQQRLQETFPDREIEVVNTALDATNTYTLLDLAPEIIEQEPDVILLYTGHNEYYGVLGVASGESVSRIPWVVRSYIELRKLRTVQALERAIDASAGMVRGMVGREPTRRTLMEYLASEHRVRYDSPLYRAGIRQFRRNLDDLLQLYARAGIPVFIGTLASNEGGQAPFISEPASSVDTAAWRRLVERAESALDRGNLTTAQEAVEAAVTMDSTAGHPFYLRGRTLQERGDAAAAQIAYMQARDRDQLPFRAPSAMNRVIRDVAAEHGAVVVESRNALSRASPHGIIDNTLMLEHLHPNIHGQFLLADSYYEALEENGEIGDWHGKVARSHARASHLVTAVDSLAGEYMIERLRSRFPFQPLGADLPAPDTLEPQTPVERIALAYHRRQIVWPEAMTQLQQHYASLGAWKQVARVHLAVAQELAQTPIPLVRAAMAQTLAGQRHRAMRYLEASEKRLPTAEAARLMGNLLLMNGDTAGARANYQRSVRLDPTNQRGKTALRALAALPELERARRERPGDAKVLADLGATYFLTGQYEKARSVAAEALDLAPDDPAAGQVLASVRTVYRNENE